MAWKYHLVLPCLDQRKSERSPPTAGIFSLGLVGVPQLHPGIDGVVRVEMTGLQLGDLKLSLTFHTVQVVTEAPQSPVNLPPAPNLNLQIRNEVAQVEVWIPGLGKTLNLLESLENIYHSCLGNTEPSTSTVRLVPLHFII